MKGWDFKADRDGVVDLRSLPGLEAEIEKAAERIAKNAAASAGGDWVTGEWSGFRWDLPAGFRWDVQKVRGRTGYVASVIGSAPTKQGRRDAARALRAAQAKAV